MIHRHLRSVLGVLAWRLSSANWTHPPVARVKRFIDLPFRIYRDCPQWVPPLVDDVKLMMNRRKYPFYEHSDADFFLAEREGRVVGRIAVLENRHYNEHCA